MSKNRLFVGNLANSVTKEQLKELFSAYGTVEDVKRIKGKNFGFVEMSNQSEAENAKTLNNTEFAGYFLKIDEARSPGGNKPKSDNYSKTTQDDKDKQKVAEIVEKIKELNFLNQISTKDLVEYANTIGRYLSPDGVNLSTNQIRKFLDAVNRLDNLRQKDGFEGMKDEIHLLRPQIAYAVGKAGKPDKKAIESLRKVLECCFSKIKIEDDFKRFVKFVEAIIAYHKYYDGKED